MLSLFSACEWPTAKTAPMREPPLIPSAPASTVQAAAPSETHVASYTDTADIQNFSPALAQAVTKALSLNVLKPPTPDSKFEPEHPICYGEFRQWANDYQNAIHTAQSQSTATAISPDSPPPVGGPMSPPASIANTQTWLPAEMLWGGHGVREQTVLTREALCALAVFLNGQDAKARKLSQSQIGSAHPGDDSTDPNNADATDGNLGQLADFPQISPWAMKYVALAYKNDWLEPVFNLSPAKITADEGLHPSQTVNRGEALLLLDLLFGQKAATVSQNQSASGPTTLSGGTTDLNSMTKPQAQITGTGLAPSNTGPGTMSQMPSPVEHLQIMKEKGPQGTRKAIQVSGPE